MVLKGKEDSLVVFDITVSRLNEALWDTNFMLQVVGSLIMMVFPGTHMVVLICSSPRCDNLPSGHQQYPLLGLNLGYMYWGQKHSSG